MMVLYGYLFETDGSLFFHATNLDVFMTFFGATKYEENNFVLIPQENPHTSSLSRNTARLHMNQTGQPGAHERVLTVPSVPEGSHLGSRSRAEEQTGGWPEASMSLLHLPELLS